MDVYHEFGYHFQLQLGVSVYMRGHHAGAPTSQNSQWNCATSFNVKNGASKLQVVGWVWRNFFKQRMFACFKTEGCKTKKKVLHPKIAGCRQRRRRAPSFYTTTSNPYPQTTSSTLTDCEAQGSLSSVFLGFHLGIHVT